ncbi:MAG: hypothetical protein FWG06_02335 [Clostridiales bacterium]|nr:hypothetical protein [Clostridiales bacterium]
MKRFCTYLSLLVFLLAGIYGVTHMALQPPTYEGSGLDVEALLEQPEKYDTTDADGAAAIIVEETLSRTGAVNAVTAVVFDFRSYDTMGEAFILFTAISGCLVMLRRTAKKEEGADGAGH